MVLLLPAGGVAVLEALESRFIMLMVLLLSLAELLVFLVKVEVL
jgi:hypothetical protein